MREIKFRAWIQKDPYSDDETPEMEMCYDLAFEEYLPINDLLKGVEHLMQSTGLKDKNGKEIYEGDIVVRYYYYDDFYPNRNDPRLRRKKVVKWVKERYQLGYNVRPNDNGNAEHLLVIGNIYENQELLNSNKKKEQ